MIIACLGYRYGTDINKNLLLVKPDIITGILSL